MINLDPSVRPTFDTLLHTSRGMVFPECFYSFLHNYVSSINDLPTNPPFVITSPPSTTSISAPSAIAPSVSSSTIRPNSSTGLNTGGVTTSEPLSDTLPSDSDHRMERIWADYESVEPYLAPDAAEEIIMDVKVDYTSPTSSSKPFQVSY
jgi:phosphoinositide-3-kinase regulatory subunit 4